MLKLCLLIVSFLVCASIADLYEEFENFPTTIWSDKAPNPFFAKWSPDHHAEYPLPPEDDDSVIQVIPGQSSGTPAHLHSVPFLLNGENRLDIRYWLRSAKAGGSRLRVQTVASSGLHETVTTITSVAAYYDSFAEESVTLPLKGGGEIYYSICIQGEREETDEGGVAIGAITLTGSTFIEPEIKTTTVLTSNGTTTTTEPDLSTIILTRTEHAITSDLVTEVTDKLTTEPSTDFKTDTTQDAITQTTVPTTVITTANPNSQLIYNFTTDVNSWAPGHSNGAHWALRTRNDILPQKYNVFLGLVRDSFYAGSVSLASPLMKTTSARVSLEIEFWGNGSSNDPASLQLFTRLRNQETAKTPFFDLSSFINRPNNGWVKVSTSFSGIIGTEVQVLLQGVLGQSQSTGIAISYVKITGAEEVPWGSPSGSLDPQGWMKGESDGSHWVMIESQDHPLALTLPSFPMRVIAVERITSRPGFATIESPVLYPAGALQRIELEFWIRGSSWSSADLTLRRRTTDGVIDSEPFLDARPYAASNVADWISVSGSLPASTKPFQIIIEGSIGSESNNQIVISKVLLTSYSKDGRMLSRNNVF